MRAHRFPLFQADFSGFSLISSIAAISSFSVGILIIPTAVKEISIGTCFKPSSPFSLLWTSIRLIKVFTMVGVNSFKSVHSRIASSKNLQINLFLFGFSDCLLVVFKLRRAVGYSWGNPFRNCSHSAVKSRDKCPLRSCRGNRALLLRFRRCFLFRRVFVQAAVAPTAIARQGD